MQFNLDSIDGKYQIKAYQPGQVMVNNQTYTNSIIISPEQIITNWTPQKFSELTAENLKIILELSPQIVILGTGEHQYFLSQELLILFLQKGIGIEVMNSDAACRTYNVLMSEGRRVVVALLIK